MGGGDDQRSCSCCTTKRKACCKAEHCAATDSGSVKRAHFRGHDHEALSAGPLKAWLSGGRARAALSESSPGAARKAPGISERLSITKAGSATLINGDLLIIKHLGTGSYGQVKLALSLRDQRLYAVKACRRSGADLLASPRAGSPRCHPLRRRIGGLSSAASSSATASGTHAAGRSDNLSPLSSCDAQSAPLLRTCSVNTRLRPSHLPPKAAAPPPLDLPPPPIVPPDLLSGPSSSCSAASTVTGVGAVAWPGGGGGGGAPPRPGRASRPRRLSGPLPLSAQHEVAIMRRLDHPNVVRLTQVIDDPSSDTLLLVMEHMEGGSLQQPQVAVGRWECLPDSEVRAHARDVLQGLAYLHAHGVVHSDIKPANLMHDRATGVTKIGDFGSAVRLVDSSPAVSCGTGGTGGTGGTRPPHPPCHALASGGTFPTCTPAFRSPESLLAGYRPACELDLWALGVCLHLWLFGQLPFKGAAPALVYDNIRTQPLALPHATDPTLHSLLSGLLEKDPLRRLSASAALSHPWLVDAAAPRCHATALAAPLAASPPLAPGGERGVDLNAGERCLVASGWGGQLLGAQSDGGVLAEGAMALIFREVHFAAGEVLASVGQVADCVYLIARGEVCMEDALPPPPISPCCRSIGGSGSVGRAPLPAPLCAATAAAAGICGAGCGEAVGGKPATAALWRLPEPGATASPSDMPWICEDGGLFEAAGMRCGGGGGGSGGLMLGASGEGTSRRGSIEVAVDAVLCSAGGGERTVRSRRSSDSSGSSSTSIKEELCSGERLTSPGMCSSQESQATSVGVAAWVKPLAAAVLPAPPPPLKRSGDSLGLCSLDMRCAAAAAAAAAAQSQQRAALLPAFATAPAVWRASARAAGDVVAYVAAAADVRALAQRHPAARLALAAAAERGECELLIGAALRQLCAHPASGSP